MEGKGGGVEREQVEKPGHSHRKLEDPHQSGAASYFEIG
jgi:hypothetical protein